MLLLAVFTTINPASLYGNRSYRLVRDVTVRKCTGSPILNTLNAIFHFCSCYSHQNRTRNHINSTDKFDLAEVFPRAISYLPLALAMPTKMKPWKGNEWCRRGGWWDMRPGFAPTLSLDSASEYSHVNMFRERAYVLFQHFVIDRGYWYCSSRIPCLV